MEIKVPQVSEFNRFRIDTLLGRYQPAFVNLETGIRWAADAAALLRDLRNAEYTMELTMIAGGGGGSPEGTVGPDGRRRDPSGV